jgi:hypothetical protein
MRGELPSSETCWDEQPCRSAQEMKIGNRKRKTLGVEHIDGVSRTWFEWILHNAMMVKVLVVEVEFDTDPDNPRFRQNVLDAIEDIVIDVSNNETNVMEGHLRIVPKGQPESRQRLTRTPESLPALAVAAVHAVGLKVSALGARVGAELQRAVA